MRHPKNPNVTDAAKQHDDGAPIAGGKFIKFLSIVFPGVTFPILNPSFGPSMLWTPSPEMSNANCGKVCVVLDSRFLGAHN